MRPVEISPDVADILGPELLARLTSDSWNEVAPCWECGRLLPPDAPAAVVLLWPVDAGQGTYRVPVHVHQGCGRSEIRRMTVAEIQVRRETQPDGPDANLDAVATVWDLGDGTGYPALLLSFREEVLLGDGSDRVDGVVVVLAAAGWHRIDALGEVPGVGPPGWQARFAVTDAEAGRGLLELINPAGELESAAEVYDAQAWLLAVSRVGASAVFMGSRYLSNWLTEGTVAGVEHASRAGRLVGGMVPVALHGTSSATR